MASARSDLTVQWRLFLGIAAFMAVTAIVYWFTSYEEAGTAMLALAAGLASVAGGYLLWQDRNQGAEPRARPEHTDVAAEGYQPHASVWPFGIGVGAFLAFNGLILSWTYAVPGVILLAVSLVGFIAQSRRRD